MGSQADLPEASPVGDPSALVGTVPSEAEAPPEAAASSRRRGIVVAVIIVGLVLGVMWAAMQVMGGGKLGEDPFGRAAPEISGPVLGAGKTLSLSSLKGKPVVVNFWASWCGPCRDEAPTLAAAYRQWAPQGVVFLGVDSEDTDADALNFVKAYGITYDSVTDPQGKAELTYSVGGFPETFFVDAKGIIRAKYVGPIDPTTLQQYIAQIANR